MKPFKGVFTALVTPFKEHHIDEAALRQLVDWQIGSGIHGLAPCGTTGESATLSMEEKKRVIQIVIDQAQKRVPVIAGTGSNNTSASIHLTQWAKEAGADGALAVTPYYNKPSQEGLYRHYTAIADIGLPVILYNVPSRTAVSLTIETIQRLSQHHGIAAIKEATASLSFAAEILGACQTRLSLISGDDFTFLPLLSLGGDGVISVTSNIIPKEFSRLYEAFTAGNLQKAREIHFKYYPLMQALFLETNPVPVKTALALMKKIDLAFRLPLCEMDPAHQQTLKKTLQGLELL